MEYLSVEQFAKIWGIHPRTVQRHCQSGLILGALKLGNNWLIPKEVASRSDARESQPSVIPVEQLTFVSGQADAQLQQFPQNATYYLARGLFAYFRCEYEQAIYAFNQLTPQDEDYLIGQLFSLYAAICLGDFTRYRKIRALFDTHQTKESHTQGQTHVLECFQANISVSLMVVHKLPNWLKKGDLSNLPPTMRDLGWYTYIKYLQIIKEYRVMLVAAEARISTQRPGTCTLCDIYIYLYAALGHLKLDNLALARERMMTVMSLALPNHFIGPFVETLTTMQGLTERCLLEAFPQRYDGIIRLWKSIFPQWVRAHNELSAYMIPEVLTCREHQVAQYAVDGLTNNQIADKMYLSLSTVKKDLSSVYDKLNIHCRRQLKELF